MRRMIRKVVALLTGTPTCKGCHVHSAEAREASVVQLCQGCADQLFPGSDAGAYLALVSNYGW